VLFPTIRFALFFMSLWAVLLLLRRHPLGWRLVLSTGNWVFYAAWSIRFTVLLAASVVINHFAVRGIVQGSTERRRRLALWSAIAANVGVLAFFKYYDFFASSLQTGAARIGWDISPPVLEIVLPLGISFFTFAAISYLVEVRRGVMAPARLLDEAVWLSFFPTVISGPITRASELIPQLDNAARTGCVDASEAFLLVLRGMWKKVVLASFLASALPDKVFATPDRYGAIEIIVAVYAFAVLLYVDFSGYTDMARGCALLIGIRLPINFDNPYGARSIRNFWDRWHITLSHWLRDFLFTPLGLRTRHRRWATYCTFVLVMMLAGLWHGAAWTFVAFGAVHGIALASERWWRDERRIHRWRRATPTRWRTALSWFVTFNVVALGWLFFRAESLGSAVHLLGRIGTAWTWPRAISPLLVVVLLAVLVPQVLPAHVRDRWGPLATIDAAAVAFRRWALPAQVAAMAGALVVIDVMGPVGVPPFIYFRF
jgi:D-alanyl-lipoteichoic acid acyltransferase DltB (MBOAT superfamily)